MKKTYRILVSSFVAFVLTFQAVISLGPIVGVEIGTLYWPLLNYAMYSRSYKEGDVIDYYRLLEGITEDGRTIPISMESLGLHLYHYRILIGDLERGRTDAFEYVHSSLPEDIRLTELRVRSLPVAVTREGPVEQEPMLLATIRVPETIGDGS